MLVDIDSLPGVVDPDVSDSLGSGVTGGEHLVGELALLGLVLVLHRESVYIHSFVIMTRTWRTKMLNSVLGAGAPSPMR